MLRLVLAAAAVYTVTGVATALILAITNSGGSNGNNSSNTTKSAVDRGKKDRVAKSTRDSTAGSKLAPHKENSKAKETSQAPEIGIAAGEELHAAPSIRPAAVPGLVKEPEERTGTSADAPDTLPRLNKGQTLISSADNMPPTDTVAPIENGVPNHPVSPPSGETLDIHADKQTMFQSSSVEVSNRHRAAEAHSATPLDAAKNSVQGATPNPQNASSHIYHESSHSPRNLKRELSRASLRGSIQIPHETPTNSTTMNAALSAEKAHSPTSPGSRVHSPNRPKPYENPLFDFFDSMKK